MAPQVEIFFVTRISGNKSIIFFGLGKNVIFGVDMNSSGHIDNKEKDILILGKGPINGLDDTMCYQQTLNIQLIFQDQIENFV